MIKTISSFTLILILTLSFTSLTQAQNRICADEVWANAGNGLPTSLDFSVQQFVEHDSSLYMIAQVRDSVRFDFVILRLDSGAWVALDTFTIDGWGQVYAAISFGGNIYMGGNWEGIDSIPNSQGIVKWDGNQIKVVADFKRGTAMGYPFINEMIVYYNELYIGGLFDSVNSVHINNLAIYNGSNFRSCPGGYADSLGTIESMHKYNGDLYLGVRHRYGVIKWDGTALSLLGDTITWAVVDFEEYDGKLVCLAPAVIDWPGGVISNEIAYWDGSRWSTFPTNTSRKINGYQLLSYDSLLYVLTSWALRWDTDQILTGTLVKYDGNDWEVASDFEWDSVNTIINFNDNMYAGGWGLLASCGNPINHVAMLCDSSDCATVSGYIYQDDDLDCIKGSGEPGLGGQLLKLNDHMYTQTAIDGSYEFQALVDSLTLKADIPANRLNHCGDSVRILVRNDTANIVDFGFRTNGSVHDMYVYSVANNLIRPGRSFIYNLDYMNHGTVPESGSLNLTFDSRVKLDSVNIPYDSISGQRIYFSYSNLTFFFPQQIRFYFTADTTLQVGDSLYFESNIDVVNGEIDTMDNVYIDTSSVATSYDPNDISVQPGNSGEIHYETEKLIYKIRFQNTGNDTAFDIRITDRVATHLDINSVRVLSSSHNYQLYFNSLNYLTFKFKDIMLPDSNVNELESHGYIVFEMDITDEAEVGTLIQKRAAIYFDYNTPIYTNFANVVLAMGDSSISVQEPQKQHIYLYPNPADDLINISSDGLSTVSVYSIQGELLQHSTFQSRKSLDISEYSNGMYFYQITTGERKQSGKFVVQH